MTDITIKIKETNSKGLKTITIKNDSKVIDIMKEIEKFSNIPPEGQKLLFKGKVLNSQEPISKYKIENGSNLIMIKKSNTENAKSKETTSSSPSTPNTVISNIEDIITIKVKTNLDAAIHNVSIRKKDTVLCLKKEIQKSTNLKPRQKN